MPYGVQMEWICDTCLQDLGKPGKASLRSFRAHCDCDSGFFTTHVPAFIYRQCIPLVRTLLKARLQEPA